MGTPWLLWAYPGGYTPVIPRGVAQGDPWDTPGGITRREPGGGTGGDLEGVPGGFWRYVIPTSLYQNCFSEARLAGGVTGNRRTLPRS